MTKRTESVGDSTRAVHGGEREHQTSDAVTTPIHQTSTFWFPDSQTLRAYQEGRLKRDEYGRYGNPTWRAVERKLCEFEGADEAETLRMDGSLIGLLAKLEEAVAMARRKGVCPPNCTMTPCGFSLP